MDKNWLTMTLLLLLFLSHNDIFIKFFSQELNFKPLCIEFINEFNNFFLKSFGAQKIDLITTKNN